MNDHAEHFSPELEAILQEIARDPRARLLRVPSSGALVQAMHAAPVGAGAAGLVRAEREVLRVHREELAERLKERCLIAFFDRPDADVRLHKSVSVGRSLEVRDREDWQRDAEALLATGIEDERTAVGADVLRKCIGPGDRPVSITQIATAMLRVAPKPQARLYIATDLLERGRPTDALELQRQTLDGGCSRLIRSYALEGMAVALWQTGRRDEALRVILEAVSVMEDRLVPILCGIDISVRNGAHEEAGRLCSLLDEVDCVDDPAVAWFTRRNRGTPSLVPLTVIAGERVKGMMNGVGPASREVLGAMLA